MALNSLGRAGHVAHGWCVMPVHAAGVCGNWVVLGGERVRMSSDWLAHPPERCHRISGNNNGLLWVTSSLKFDLDIWKDSTCT